MRRHEAVGINAGLDLQADAHADVLNLRGRTADAGQRNGIDDRNLIAGDDLRGGAVEGGNARPRDGAPLSLLYLRVNGGSQIADRSLPRRQILDRIRGVRDLAAAAGSEVDSDVFCRRIGEFDDLCFELDARERNVDLCDLRFEPLDDVR